MQLSRDQAGSSMKQHQNEIYQPRSVSLVANTLESGTIHRNELENLLAAGSPKVSMKTLNAQRMRNQNNSSKQSTQRAIIEEARR